MNTAALRTLMIYAVILPLALFIGWMTVDLANWDRTSFMVIAGSLFFLTLPLLLKWHYTVMVLSWNSAITIFFLPGKPELWVLMVGFNFGFALLYRIIQKRPMFLSAPTITMSLLALLTVTLITAKLRGGFGLQVLGSSTYGGKSYFYLIAGILGYFAMASMPIPPARANAFVAMFFLPGLNAALSTLIYFAGPSFYFLYLVFPVSFAGVQAMTEYSGTAIVRVVGFAVAACSFSAYLMTVYGVRGIIRKWWLGLLLIVVLSLGTLGGYRSLVLVVGFMFIILFVMVGLLRSPIFPALILIGGLIFVGLISFAEKLPLSAQRTLAAFPIKVDPVVRADAESSLQWRLQMWQLLLPDLPKYIWLGKGYALNPTDLYLAEQAAQRNRAKNYQTALMSGGYHSGPLSTYVPLGGFGTLAFIAFLGASLRALYLNYRYGDEALRTINRGLFAYFLGSLLFFIFAFGALSAELFKFTGAVGLSIALNHGVCRKPVTVSRPVRIRGSLDLSPAPAS